MSYLGEGPGVDEFPEMMSECPICLERLFDDSGIACNGEVAKMMCFHLVHDECLRRAAQSLNADGNRYGVGGFGPRAGCPVCNRPVSFWTSYKHAAAFPIFWMNKIISALNMFGEMRRGPVSLILLMEFLKEDRHLTDTAKKHIHGSAFRQAIEDGSKFVVWEQTDEGREKMYCKKMAWCFDPQDLTLWLYKWGDAPTKTREEIAIMQQLPNFMSDMRYGEMERRGREEMEQRRMIARNWLIFIGIVILAIAASIYFDNGEEISW